jgi:hypothetical protein
MASVPRQPDRLGNIVHRHAEQRDAKLDQHHLGDLQAASLCTFADRHAKIRRKEGRQAAL